jgi:8-oxo-dGTP pyrophosphatase MutT (NUDIX family)
MKKILEINDNSGSDYHHFECRLAARAVALRYDNEIPLLYVGTGDYYKLPGGGIEPGENLEAALRREVLEETGSSIDVVCGLGYVVEFRHDWKLIQISFAFLAKVIREAGEPNFTAKEKEKGFRLKWLKLEAASKKLADENGNNYQTGFIVKRDSAILAEALSVLKERYRGKLFEAGQV